MLPRIEIQTKGICSEVFIDGEKVNGVRGYTLSHEPGKAPVLHLDLQAINLFVDGAMIPALPECFEPFYVPKDDLSEE